ncbi:hypothetical protein ACEPAH_182 [Sanghuangporus vaninii]
MSESSYYALQVIRVGNIQGEEQDSALYVEVKLDNTIRKTGTLNANAEPAWNGTLTFSRSDDATAFDVRLRKSMKRIGHVNINAAELLRESAENDVQRDLVIPQNILRFSRNRLRHAGSIILRLRTIDAQTRAEIEISAADECATRLNALVQRTDTAAEVISTAIEVADAIIEIVDSVAQIHPVFNVTWQIITSLYKVLSQQLRTDSRLVDLLDKMKDAYKFYTEAGSLADKTELLKPKVKALVNETVECSRFVQSYATHNFLSRATRVPARRKIDEYSTRFDRLRKELDSVIGLHGARTADAIRMFYLILQTYALLPTIYPDEQQRLDFNVGLDIREYQHLLPIRT